MKLTKDKLINEGTEAKIYSIKETKDYIIRESNEELRIKLIDKSLRAEILEEGEGYAIVEKLRQPKTKYIIFELEGKILEETKVYRLVQFIKDDILEIHNKKAKNIKVCDKNPRFKGIDALSFDSFIQVSHKLPKSFSNKIFDLMIKDYNGNTKKMIKFFKNLSNYMRDNNIKNENHDLGDDNIGIDKNGNYKLLDF
jgi:hypothetical protein